MGRGGGRLPCKLYYMAAVGVAREWSALAVCTGTFVHFCIIPHSYHSLSAADLIRQMHLLLILGLLYNTIVLMGER